MMAARRSGAAVRASRLPMLLLAAACIVAACGGPGAPTAEQPDHVRAVVMPYLTFMPFHIAAQEGYFAAQNLEVEFIRLPRIQELMTGLARGEVDVAGGMLTTTVLNSIAGGARMRMVGALGHLPDDCAFSGFVVRRELYDEGALEDPERLRELTWDADILIPYGYWLDELLRPFGLGFGDLDIVNLQEATAVEAILTDSIDVTVVTEPFLSRLVASPQDAVAWKSVAELVPGYQISNLMYGPTFLDERPEVGRRFAIAMLQAIRQFNEGKTPRNLQIVEEASGLTAKQVAAACWPAARTDGLIPAGAFAGYQEWMLSSGLAERTLSDSELIDPGFMIHANEALDR